MLRAFSALVLSLLMVVAGGAVRAGAEPDAHFLGEQRIAHDLQFDGTTVGGLSGIDRDPATGAWYIVSDDRSDIDPARFYRADLSFQGGAFSGVTLTGTTPMLRPDGTTFAPSGSDPKDSVDPESIRFERSRSTLLWTSEGERIVDPPSAQVLVDPFVREMTQDGRFVRELPLPDDLHMSAENAGPRRNLTLEGVTATPDERWVLASMEAPLYQDGPEPTVSAGGITRLTRWDRLTGQVVAQYAYPEDAVPLAPVPPTGSASNGVSEMLSVDDNHMLMLERSFSDGAGNSIRLYAIDTSGATDVLHTPSLANGGYRPVRKKLVMDLGTFNLPKIDNVEGVAFGPRLANGQRTLVFISDDNFSASQVTQLLAFSVPEGALK